MMLGKSALYVGTVSRATLPSQRILDQCSDSDSDTVVYIRQQEAVLMCTCGWLASSHRV